MACPQCRVPAKSRDQNAAFPFCSERCRLIDLGAWLDERYRVPGEAVDGESLPPAEDDKPSRPH